MVLFGIQMVYTLTKMVSINMEDTMMIIMNIFQVKDGMRLIIVM
jgi:hypothetical protein